MNKLAIGGVALAALIIIGGYLVISPAQGENPVVATTDSEVEAETSTEAPTDAEELAASEDTSLDTPAPQTPSPHPYPCGAFTFEYPKNWFAWNEDLSSYDEKPANNMQVCTTANFPQNEIEQRAAGIAQLTNDANDAFVSIRTLSNQTRPLDEIIDSYYCPKDTDCGIETVYIIEKKKIPFAQGEAYTVLDTGGEYPADLTYYYKKGSELAVVNFDLKNTVRQAEIRAIAESVR